MEKARHKYEILYYHLKNQILNGTFQYGDRLPTENELAAQFSLSRFTVRHAIEKLANEGFLEKRRGSGTYVKAAKSGQNRAGVVGIITTYLDDYIFPSIIRGIESVLTRHGFSLHLGITENKISKENACLRAMLARNIDGLIIEGTKSALINSNISLLETMRERNVPIVFINGNYNDFDSSYVLMDDEMSGQIAAQYLIEKGHQRIGGIFKSDDIQGHRRFRGMENSMRKYKIPVNERAILWYTTENMEQIFAKSYDRFFLQRFQNCTALICYNDQIAIRTIQTLERNGIKVPADVSIIGFDNSELCEISPVKLTSITHERSAMGEAAANMLLELLAQNDQKCIKKLCFQPKLIPRESVMDLLTQPSK